MESLIFGCIKLIRTATGRVCVLVAEKSKQWQRDSEWESERKHGGKNTLGGSLCGRTKLQRYWPPVAWYQSIRTALVKIVLEGSRCVFEKYPMPSDVDGNACEYEIDTARIQACCSTFCRRKLIYFPITSKSIAIWTNCIHFVSFTVICSYVITSRFVRLHWDELPPIGNLASHQFCQSQTHTHTTYTHSSECENWDCSISHGLIFFLQIWFIVCHHKYLFLIY